MTDKEYIRMLQQDPLYRELPDASGDRFAGKLAVAAVLGLVLAAVGGLTEARHEQTAVSRIETPWTATPPTLVVEDAGSDHRAAR